MGEWNFRAVSQEKIGSVYKLRGTAALPVEIDIDALTKLGLKVMPGNLASLTDQVRHDPSATSAVVVKLAQEGRRRKS